MKQIKKYFSFSLLVILLFSISFIVLYFFSDRHATAVLQIGEKKVYVQIAKTIGQQQKGLGEREKLLPYGGMVFPYFPAKKIGIVMRDMEFPIDVFWVRGGVIVDIAPNIPPEPGVEERALRRYYPRIAADMVIETEAGFAQKYDIKIGNRVQIIDE